APARQAPAPSGLAPSAPIELAPTSRGVEPAVLLVEATPSGSVYIDGQLVGTTPLGGVVVSPGLHRLRVEHEGFLPYERTIDLPAGQTTRLTEITLQAVPQ
ncbi:MAG TPA: PEGA domain-containing protein, partial [Gemmatimonadales bacterium]